MQIKPLNRQLMPWNFQIQFSYLHSNVIMCIATLLTRWRKRQSPKILINISWYFNHGIDIMKITALSNYKPGILNKYSKTLFYCPSIHRQTHVSPRISAVPFSVCSNNPVKMPNSHTAIRHGNWRSNGQFTVI